MAGSVGQYYEREQSSPFPTRRAISRPPIRVRCLRGIWRNFAPHCDSRIRLRRLTRDIDQPRSVAEELSGHISSRNPCPRSVWENKSRASGLSLLHLSKTPFVLILHVAFAFKGASENHFAENLWGWTIGWLSFALDAARVLPHIGQTSTRSESHYGKKRVAHRGLCKHTSGRTFGRSPSWFCISHRSWHMRPKDSLRICSEACSAHHHT